MRHRERAIRVRQSAKPWGWRIGELPNPGAPANWHSQGHVKAAKGILGLFLVLLEQVARDDQALQFVRAATDHHQRRVAIVALHREILRIAVGAQMRMASNEPRPPRFRWRTAWPCPLPGRNARRDRASRRRSRSEGATLRCAWPCRPACSGWSDIRRSVCRR